MKQKLLILIIFYSLPLLSLSAQDSVNYSDTESRPNNDPADIFMRERSFRNKSYSINLSIRVYDDEKKAVVNSSWNSITMSGKPVTINITGSNLNLAAILIPYQVDENTVMLLAHGKVLLKPVDSSEEKYYSTVNSLSLKIGEKALFFPLGLLDEKMDNISSCVLEIEVHHYDNKEIMIEKNESEKGVIDSIEQERQSR